MEISNITNSDRSEVLVQALPYIQKYQNKTANKKTALHGTGNGVIYTNRPPAMGALGGNAGHGLAGYFLGHFAQGAGNR